MAIGMEPAIPAFLGFRQNPSHALWLGQESFEKSFHLQEVRPDWAERCPGF